MRSITTIAASTAILAISVATLPPSARADNNDFLNQAKKFLNSDNDRDRSAYERGREDEWRRQQADQDRDRYRRDQEGNWRGNRPGYDSRYGSSDYREDRYRDPNYR